MKKLVNTLTKYRENICAHLFDKSGAFKIEILKSPVFIIVLFLKLGAAFLFASDFLVNLFAPFVNYYITSGFQNPYAFFYRLGVLNVFPYPQAMLWILSIPRMLFAPFLGNDYAAVSNLNIFLYRLPLLFADIIIFIILARWLKNHQKKVLWFYWCSPILFYITYIHGQLDVLPIMFVFVFLYFLFKERWYASFVFFGLALATKIHVIALAPFIAVYLLLKKRDWGQIALAFLIAVTVFVLLNYNILFTSEFFEIVLKTKEQFKVLDFQFPLGNGLVIYLIPLAYAMLFIHSATYRAYNRDIFLMFLGFVFGILTLLIPPMQGWYYWIIPFLTYFYVKQRNAPTISFIALNVLYFLYFLIVRQSDFFEVFQLTVPAIAATPNLYHALAARGIDMGIVVNVVFTFLQGVLFMNVLWIYRKGIESNMRHKMHYQPYLIGFTGDSGSGKTTFASLLRCIFGEKNTAVVEGDDMHKWERGHPMWNIFTHLDPRANELHTDLYNALRLKTGEDVERKRYDHGTGTFTLPKKFESKKVIIFEGLHALFLNTMRRMLDLKIFVKTDEELRLHWKIMRDVAERGHTKEKVIEKIQERAGDAKQYVEPQEQHSDIVIAMKNSAALGDAVGNTDIPLDIRLEFKCSNDINMDALLAYLTEFGNVECRHTFFDTFQTVELHGAITADLVGKISYALIPELWEMSVHEPEWVENYQGLIQLFICYCIFEKLKMENYGK